MPPLWVKETVKLMAPAPCSPIPAIKPGATTSNATSIAIERRADIGRLFVGPGGDQPATVRVIAEKKWGDHKVVRSFLCPGLIV